MAEPDADEHWQLQGLALDEFYDSYLRVLGHVDSLHEVAAAVPLCMLPLSTCCPSLHAAPLYMLPPPVQCAPLHAASLSMHCTPMHPLSLVLVVMIKPKELKTKIVARRANDVR